MIKPKSEGRIEAGACMWTYVGEYQPADPTGRFGGGDLVGCVRVEDALMQAKLTDLRMAAKGSPVRLTSASFHLGRELRSRKFPQFNLDRAVSLERVIRLYRDGMGLPIRHLTVPSFGGTQDELHHLSSADEFRRLLAIERFKEAIDMAIQARQQNCGEADVLVWTGFDCGELANFLPRGMMMSIALNRAQPQRAVYVASLLQIAEYARVREVETGVSIKIYIEIKGHHPVVSYVFTPFEGRALVKELNEKHGHDRFRSLTECAHAQTAGVRASDAVQAEMDEGVFGDDVHANAGDLCPINYEQAFQDDEVEAEAVVCVADQDKWFGKGGSSVIADSQDLVRRCLDYSARTGRPVRFHLDITTWGRPPYEAVESSIEAIVAFAARPAAIIKHGS